MARTQSKCFFVSAIAHSLVLVLLVVGSAFVTKTERVEDVTFIKTFDASKLTDDIVAPPGGGEAPPAIVTPQPPIAQPIVVPAEPIRADVKPPEVKPPVVEKEMAKPEKPVRPREKPPMEIVKKLPENKDPSALKPVTAKTKDKPTVEKKKIEVDLNNIVKPNPDQIRKQKERIEKEARQAREREEARQAEIGARAERDRQIAAINAANTRAQQVAKANADAVKSTLRSLQSGMSSGTSVEMPGPGAGAFANYGQVIWSLYYEAWRTPEARNGNATAKVEIVVARDGRVISADLINPSGDAAMDRSIRQVLESVRKLPAFPEGSKDERRTFRIPFNLIAKRLNG